MKKAPLKSGGFVNILEEGEAAIPGEVNFSGKELAWARKISVSTNDPEAEKEFWKTTIEKKRNDPGYSLFTDFPESSTDAPTKTLAEKYCQEIKDQLRSRGARTKSERDTT